MYHGVSWNDADIQQKQKPLEMRFNLTESINSVLPLTDNPKLITVLMGLQKKNIPF
jgi:hypothetical protein